MQSQWETVLVTPFASLGFFLGESSVGLSGCTLPNIGILNAGRNSQQSQRLTMQRSAKRSSLNAATMKPKSLKVLDMVFCLSDPLGLLRRGVMSDPSRLNNCFPRMSYV